MGSAIVGGLIGLLGVILGIYINGEYQERKEKRKIENLKNGLIDELRANVFMVKQKRQIIKQILDCIDNDEFLPGTSTRFATNFFTNCFPHIISQITIKERNSFHIIYEYFRIIDSQLDNFTERVIECLGKETLNDICKIYSVMLKDILSVLDVLEELIQEHLKGNPKDVFQSGEIEMGNLSKRNI